MKFSTCVNRESESVLVGSMSVLVYTIISRHNNTLRPLKPLLHESVFLRDLELSWRGIYK